MAQNIYDQPAFFEGYSSLPRSVHGLAGAAEWESVRALLPDLKGKRVVDLGCGFGWFARYAAEEGAASVLGLDLSENMIARAKAETQSPAVRYEIADLDQLELPAGGFDFAYSSLAFHYIADFDRLIRTIHAALVLGAHFIFTIEHPLYMAPSAPDWAEVGGRTVWPVDGYLVEGPRTTDWLAKGVVKHHRHAWRDAECIDRGRLCDPSCRGMAAERGAACRTSGMADRAQPSDVPAHRL